MKPQFTSAESVPENSGLTRRPRIGVVGLGSIAQKAYLPILSQAERWELVGAFSRDRQKTQRICQDYRMTSFSALDELAAQCDAVFVHSSTASHFSVVSQLIKRVSMSMWINRWQRRWSRRKHWSNWQSNDKKF